MKNNSLIKIIGVVAVAVFIYMIVSKPKEPKASACGCNK